MTETVASSSLRRPAELLSSLREVNRRICQLAAGKRAVFICECGSPECLSTLELDVSEYEEIRLNPSWAILNPGHGLAESGRVVRRGSGFLVVERLLLKGAEPAQSG